MMGRLMQESSVSFHDWLTMKKRRKTRRPVYHMTRLSSSLSASLIVLVFVVTCDTSSPDRGAERKKKVLAFCAKVPQSAWNQCPARNECI